MSGKDLDFRVVLTDLLVGDAAAAVAEPTTTKRKNLKPLFIILCGAASVILLTVGLFMLLLGHGLTGLWPGCFGLALGIVAIVLLALQKRDWIAVLFLSVGFWVVVAFMILLARLN